MNMHAKFHSTNVRRKVLVVDDELINRELLRLALEDAYETITASDGESALALVEEHRDTLSLIMLDLLMPGMHGFEVLRILKEDPELERIPVIVLTADQKAEVESLKMGAVDFISKPYPQQEVILARVTRNIELAEDRDIIQYTERDSLTGLYNREYFFRYARQFDQHHKDAEMDAIVVDAHHFRMINERYGKAFGDEVLRGIGEKLREMVRESGGIVCRREADTFLAYCPHREDYQAILDSASIGLIGDGASGNRVRLRMGVYARVDKAIEMERRFDRAKMAADTVRGSYMNRVAFYDNALHESEIYAERLLEDFQDAVNQRQFKVFFQPKFDVRPEIPVLASAEALVRWIHPELGFISPGNFIPLFEENGLIQQLDLYVWRETAAQIKDWKTRLGISVPVSVNVSRVDMYDPNLVNTLLGILKEYELSPDELLLEITESAYTQDSEQIINKVNRLRELGFRIEMDDFGTGYSSLNMISNVPIDALKLDMTFIRNAFKDGGDTRLIEIIIDIADYLSVPVIAEGVETEAQLNTLKAMGCDLVQGYYFSKPVPAEEYEIFVKAKKRRMEELGASGVDAWIAQEVQPEDQEMPSSIARALTSGYEIIYYIDTRTGHYVEFSTQGKYEDLQIERSGSDFFSDCQRNIARVIYPDDRERVGYCMQKETLLPQLIGGQAFSMTYRLLINDEAVYHSLRAIRAYTRDDHHIVVGVSNVDDQIRQFSDSRDNVEKNRQFFTIAQALSSDFECIYYVDTLTNDYAEFTAQGSYETLKIELSGQDFFAECQQNLLNVVYFEDQAKVSAALEKDALLEHLEREQTFGLVYRLLIDGMPTWYRMKIVRAEDGRHIVIGVSNAAAQMAREMEYRTTEEDRLTYARIAQALARDYFSIYYIDTETDQFIEYMPDRETRELRKVRDSEDFFGVCRGIIRERVLPEDQARVMAVYDKEKLLEEVSGGRAFAISCRIMYDGEPVFASIKALRLQGDAKHLLVGISNIDAQARMEEEYEKAKRENVTFSSIAQALAADYFSIYYVDVVTDRFIEYSAHDDYGALGIEKGGDDFFNLSRKNILRVVHPDDHEKILNAFTKEKLMAEMKKSGTFTLTYRLMFNGTANYVSMKATRMSDDDQHIVIGVNNINAQVERQLAFDAAKAESGTYARIAQALSRDYYSIYLVNTETDEFIEYSSSEDYQDLHVEQSGVNFFKDCRRNVMRLVYKEDLEKALAVWDKARLMPELADGKTFSTTYRLMMDGEPVYINCKVIRMADVADMKYIVIGVSNVDEQMRRERELMTVRDKANRDALTGVKSKHAYMDSVAELNTQIETGDIQPFSVVVCDVNGLKTINDTLGHHAGDKLILDAAHVICNTFKHSPVFRVGGDEFVAILRGSDHERGDELMAEMARHNAESKAGGGVIIACGASQWRPGVDNRFEAVFDRADSAMYENKTALKTVDEQASPDQRD